jgi:hypothetical protein
LTSARAKKPVCGFGLFSCSVRVREPEKKPFSMALRVMAVPRFPDAMGVCLNQTFTLRDGGHTEMVHVKGLHHNSVVPLGSDMDAVRATLNEIGRWTQELRSDRLEVSDVELRCYIFLMPFCAGAPSRLAVTALALRAERALVLLVDDFNRLGPTWSVFGSTAQCFLCSVMRQRLVYNIANIEP